MPGEAIFHIVVEVILEPIVQIFCYFTARLVFPVISLGNVRVEKSSEDSGLRWKWRGGISRDKRGKIVLNAEFASLLMLLILFGIILIFAIVEIYGSL